MSWKLLPLAVALGLTGCTLGTGGKAQTLADTMTEGTYQLSFSANPTGAAAPVGGVNLTLALPAGVTVATTADGTGQILGTSLTAGSALKGTTLLVGKYAPASNLVHFTLTTVAATAWSGEYARLKISVPAGATFTQQTLLAGVSGSFTGYKVVGLAGAGYDTTDLTGSVPSNVSLVP
jgi:hypothetical protein